jgi:hypothetical protein
MPCHPHTGNTTTCLPTCSFLKPSKGILSNSYGCHPRGGDIAEQMHTSTAWRYTPPQKQTNTGVPTCSFLKPSKGILKVSSSNMMMPKLWQQQQQRHSHAHCQHPYREGNMHRRNNSQLHTKMTVGLSTSRWRCIGQLQATTSAAAAATAAACGQYHVCNQNDCCCPASKLAPAAADAAAIGITLLLLLL